MDRVQVHNINTLYSAQDKWIYWNLKLQKRTAITADLIWDNEPTSFPEIKEQIEGHLLQCGMPYIIHPKFIKCYQEHGEDAAFMTISPSLDILREQFIHDRIVLYGMMKSIFCKPACKNLTFDIVTKSSVWKHSMWL